MPQLLHNHKEFNALISIVANNMSIAPALIEKDYWIMHCLYGLQKIDLAFELTLLQKPATIRQHN
jgi:hypothetical protein